MITKIEAVAPNGQILELPLEDSSGGYLVKEIGGLEPVKAQIVTSSFAQLNGEEYQSSRLERRDIALTLGLEPVYGVSTVSSLRNQLYKFFMPQTPTLLRFYEDYVHVANIAGRVETFDNNRFQQEPEIVIGIPCFDPDFISPEVVTFNGVTTSGLLAEEIGYQGTVDAGFLLRMSVDRPLGEFTIYNSTGDGVTLSLEIDYPWLAGDIVEISTVPGAKGAHMIRSGFRSSLLYAVNASSNYMKFMQGSNLFRVQAAGAAIPFSIQYKARYGGL